MKCPQCQLENPENTRRCDCGYDFSFDTLKMPRDVSSSISRGQQVSNVKRSYLKFNLLLCATILTGIVVLHTCVLIEMLNKEAGNFLPRTDPEFLGPGNPKWRLSRAGSTEASWRKYTSQGISDETLMYRELSQEEYARMKRETARNALRTIVSFWGVLQYLLAPLSLLFSIVLARRDERKISRGVAWGLILTNTLSIIMMIYRGYFPSLGW